MFFAVSMYAVSNDSVASYSTTHHAVGPRHNKLCSPSFKSIQKMVNPRKRGEAASVEKLVIEDMECVCMYLPDCGLQWRASELVVQLELAG